MSYFRFFGARCESADAAAVFDGLLVRPSRSTFDAAFAALDAFLAVSPSPSLPSTGVGCPRPPIVCLHSDA